VLTIKGVTSGISRLEFEYEIPRADADRLLDDLCERPLIEKTRYRVSAGGVTWEIDEFHGDNAGLVVAEVELAREDQPFERPAWLGDEVSGDPRYFNANLVAHPFREWAEPARPS
jgi:CYTH domain-containing protein